jgi:hypothetical protein
MPSSFKWSRRIARLRLPITALLVLSLAACDSADSVNPDASTPEGVDLGPTNDPISQIEEDTPVEEDGLAQMAPVDDPVVASASFAGGIPIGTTAQPTAVFGDRFNGALRNIWPDGLTRELAAIRSRGGKVVLMFAGNEQYYRDASGNFSLTKWKARIDRFRRVNFDDYVRDGTIVGHYLIDEPNDPANWNGDPIPPSVVEQMAQYSKQIWPSMTTIARVDPSYLRHDHRHLDAAWAQYVYRKGTAAEYIRRNVDAAQERGLGLVTGLNVLKGGPNGSKMSASQVKEWGSTLLASSYPCAFISWQYNEDYLSSSSMKDAMDALRNKAENRSTKSCRG